MSSIKICLVSLLLVVVCFTRWVVTGPAEHISHQTAASQQGGPVLFFATFQGSLRDIEIRKVIFNKVLVNQGSAYNNQTGVFTAPVAGIYQFVFAAQLCRGNHNNMWYFVVRGENGMMCHAQVSGGDTTLNTCYLMEELNEGDQVWLKQRAGSCAWASTTSKTINFSGVLLASEGASMVGGKLGSGNFCLPPSQGRQMKMVSSSARRISSCSIVISSLLLCGLLWG